MTFSLSEILLFSSLGLTNIALISFFIYAHKYINSRDAVLRGMIKDLIVGRSSSLDVDPSYSLYKMHESVLKSLSIIEKSCSESHESVLKSLSIIEKSRVAAAHGKAVWDKNSRTVQRIESKE